MYIHVIPDNINPSGFTENTIKVQLLSEIL